MEEDLKPLANFFEVIVYIGKDGKKIANERSITINLSYVQSVSHLNEDMLSSDEIREFYSDKDLNDYCNVKMLNNFCHCFKISREEFERMWYTAVSNAS